MTRLSGLRFGAAVLVLLGVTLAARTVVAQDAWSTEGLRAIHFFPKVTNETGRKTVIELSNATNLPVFAHCFYVNGATVQGSPLWQVTDFSLTLTRQQPTHWCVGDGRPVSPSDGQQGLDPGSIPPVPVGFIGGLVCVEVMASGEPSAANSLVGKATITQADSEGNLVAVSGYNSIGVPALGGGNTEDNVASLDDLEFAACPGGAYLNFVSEGLADDALNNIFQNSVGIPASSTTLAVMPCAQDFETLSLPTAHLSFSLRDEFEQQLNTTRAVECFTAINMGDLLGDQLLLSGATYRYALITAEGPPSGDDDDDDDGLGFVAVSNVALSGADGSISTAASNLHFFDNTAATNLDPSPGAEIRLPDPDPFN